MNAQSTDDIVVTLRDSKRSADSEYGALRQAIRESYAGAFRKLRENERRPDLTLLSRRTGWDARAIAMMGQADVLSEATNLPRPMTYALMRAGLPSDHAQLVRVTTDGLADVWRSAAENEVIGAVSKAELKRGLDAFREFRQKQAGEVRIYGEGDKLNDVLKVSGLADEIHQALLARIADTEGRVWKDMDGWLEQFEGDQDKRAAIIGRLKLDAGLSRLTQGNAGLMTAVHGAIEDFERPEQIVWAGFYRPGRWADIIDPARIPDIIPDGREADRIDAYSRIMAASVELTWPTAVVAARLLDGNDPLALPDASAEITAEVAGFLGDAGRGFELGLHPFSDYRRKNATGLSEEASLHVMTLQRLWQVTEDSESLARLLSTKLTSAREIAAHSRAEFVSSYSKALGGDHRALNVYDRARQVHGSTIAISHIYLKEKSTPQLSSVMSALVANKAPDEQTSAQATLETLFGSLDACACEHCQSILSPAAYLVDVFSFIDRPNAAKNPLKLLFKRRPDLEHIPLSCKNTHKEMPLVDFSNEILQHIVGAKELELKNFRGFDTPDDVSNEDLRAAPQFEEIPVGVAADADLAAATYPPPLPYVRNLDRLRTTLDGLSVAMHDAMRTYRAHDNLDRGGAAYGWRDIRLEQAGLDRSTHELLTNAGLNLAKHYGYPAATGDAAVRNALTKVQDFIRRSKIDYQQLIDMLGMRYINPAMGSGQGFSALRVRFSAVRGLKNGNMSEADFRKLLPADLDESAYDNDVVGWLTDDARYGALTTIIVLSNPEDPDALCELDQLQLERLSADPADRQVLRGGYVRLARFIRVWRRLGWLMADVDAAIWSLLPDAAKPDGVDDPNDEAQMAAGFDQALIGLGAVHSAIDVMRVKVNRDLRSLLALWAPIDHTGPDSLYARLFLQRPGVSNVFRPDSDGNVLQGAAKIADHAEAVRGALRISGDDWTLLLAELNIDPANAALTLDLVSSLYRHSWLARALRISLPELFALMAATNLDPFTAPTTAQPDLLQLAELVKAIDGSKLKLASVLYLIWDRDLRRQAALDVDETRVFAAQLRNDLRTAVENLDTSNTDDANLLAIFSSVYGDDAAFFHSLVTSTFAVSEPYRHNNAMLPQAVTAASGDALSYDDVRKQLSHAGYLTDNQRNAIINAGNNEGLGQEFVDAVNALRARCVDRTRPFFEAHPELRTAFDDFLNDGAGEAARLALIESLAGALARARMQSQAITTLSGFARSPVALGERLLTDGAAFHANRVPGGDPVPAIHDLLAMAKGGLTAEFWLGPVNANPDEVRTATVVDHAAGGDNALPDNGGNTINGRWRGYVTGETDGPHEFVIEGDVGAQIALRIGRNNVPLSVEAQGLWVSDAAVDISSSTPSQLQLEVGNVVDRVRLLWRSGGTTRSGRHVAPAAFLLSQSHVDDLIATTIRFRKMATLTDSLMLTPDAAHWLAANPARQINNLGWVHALGVTADGVGDQQLLPVLLDLLHFEELRAKFPNTDVDLVAHLREPDAADSNGPLLDRRLAWPTVDVEAMLAHIGLARVDLNDLGNLQRLAKAIELASTIGVSARVLIGSLTNDPDTGQARRFLDALRARYDDRAWRQLIEPINDDLRRRRRDALIARTLHLFSRGNARQKTIDTAEKLYEHLLVDVSSDPCFPTSRVRQAMSAAQQFVDRIANSAEPDIDPDVIDHKQWEFMSRYRVWEVVRKLLIQSENYMVPDLYDMPSPEFSSLIKELTQGDVSDEAAAIALTRYLGAVERIARLEPVGMFDASTTTSAEDLHFVSRTLGRDQEWFYRRFAHGSWMPFVPIGQDIEGDPVQPIVWQGRTFVFWLRISQETVEQEGFGSGTGSNKQLQSITTGELGSQATARANQQKARVFASLAFSEYADGTWKPPKGSDPDTPSYLGEYPANGPNRFRRRELRLEFKFHPDDALYIDVDGSNSGGRFKVYAPHSDPEVDPPVDGKGTSVLRTLGTYNNELVASYGRKMNPSLSHSPYTIVDRKIIRGSHPFQTVDPGRWVRRPWTAPFTVADRRNVYLVRSTTPSLLQQAPVAVDWWIPKAVEAVWTQVVVEQIPLDLVIEPDPPIDDDIQKPRPDNVITTGDHLRVVFNTGRTFNFNGVPIGPNGGLRY